MPTARPRLLRRAQDGGRAEGIAAPRGERGREGGNERVASPGPDLRVPAGARRREDADGAAAAVRPPPAHAG